MAADLRRVATTAPSTPRASVVEGSAISSADSTWRRGGSNVSGNSPIPRGLVNVGESAR